MEKIVKGNNRGITLIALVITIIVLLILAGVALSALTGDSGILSNAEKAKDNTKKSNLKEEVGLAVQELLISKYTNGQEITTPALSGKLESTGYTVDEKDTGWEVADNNGNKVWLSKDGNVTEGTTLGSILTSDMNAIAEINYSPNQTLPTDVKWVIIGFDEKGNILATTSRPLGNETNKNYSYNLVRTGEKWLTYETDLNNACKNNFSGVVQGKTVTARSIKIEDVNALSGFEEPEFDIYTFKNVANNDFGNKIVGFYHPDEKATNFWSKTEKQYQSNSYFYSQAEQGISRSVGGLDGPETTILEGELIKNQDFLFGNSSNPYEYLLASRSVEILRDGVKFWIRICSVHITTCQ